MYAVCPLLLQTTGIFLCLFSGYVAFGGGGEKPTCSCGTDPGDPGFSWSPQAQPSRAAHTETGEETFLNSTDCFSAVWILTVLNMAQSASAGGNGRVQAEGGGGAAVSERPLATGGSSDQPSNLPHSPESAAGGQPAATHHHPTVQHPAGRLQPSLEWLLTSVISVYSLSFGKCFVIYLEFPCWQCISLKYFIISPKILRLNFYRSQQLNKILTTNIHTDTCQPEETHHFHS